MDPGTACLEMPPDEAALDGLMPWAEDFATRHALPEGVSFALMLCLEEAVSNAVRHAGSAVVVRLRAGTAGVTAELEDRGPPFDPLQAAPPAAPASLDDAVPGGLGIHLMRQFCGDITYARSDGANRLTMSFPF